MRYGNEPGFRSQELLEFFKPQFAAVVDGSHAQGRAFFFAQNLPGHDVGVMLHGGDQNFIARADVLAAVGLGYQVDRFRGASRKDDLSAVRGVQKTLYRNPGLFVVLRRPLRESMHATMDIGVIVAIVVFNGFDYRHWLLRGGRVVQVDQRLAVNALVKNGKIAADFLHVKARRGGNRMRNLSDRTHLTSSNVLSVNADRSPANFAVSGSHCTTRRSTWSRTGPGCMRSRHSLAKASSRRCFAETSLSPRERR